VIILDSISYFIKDYSDIILLIILIRLCTRIQQKYFYFIFLILSFPITLLSTSDALINVIAIILLFFMLRVRCWRGQKEKKSDEIFGFLFSVAIYAIAPLFSSIAVTALFKLDYDIVNNRQFLLLITLICLNWFFSIIVCLWIRKNILSKKYSNEEKKIYIAQQSVFLVSIYVIAEILRKMNILGILSVVMVGFLIAQFIFTIVLTYISIKKNKEKSELENLKNEMTMMSVYTDEVEKNYQEMIKFRHDYKNLLIGIQSNPNALQINKDYLNKIIDYSQEIMDTSIMSFSGIQNLKIHSLKSLMITKLTQAKNASLNIKFECLYEVNYLNIDEVDLIRILGILLDNAIEAASVSTDRNVTTLFIAKSNNLEITIENSYVGKIPSISEINKQGFSTKGKNRGIGLSNVREIIKEYKDIELEHFALQGLFVSTLSIGKETI